jgi:hypothetical protein
MIERATTTTPRVDLDQARTTIHAQCRGAAHDKQSLMLNRVQGLLAST